MYEPADIIDMRSEKRIEIKTKNDRITKTSAAIWTAGNLPFFKYDLNVYMG